MPSNKPSDVVDFRICHRFQFSLANPQMFALRNRFANPQTKTLSPQFGEVPSTGNDSIE